MYLPNLGASIYKKENTISTEGSQTYIQLCKIKVLKGWDLRFSSGMISLRT